MLVLRILFAVGEILRSSQIGKIPELSSVLLSDYHIPIYKGHEELSTASFFPHRSPSQSSHLSDPFLSTSAKMQYLQILLGLATAVSAIDLRFFAQGGCRGSYMVCTNWNPNVCCGSDNIRYTSIGFAAIPTSWRIETRAYVNGRCNTLAVLVPTQGRMDVCLNEPSGFARLSGAGYGFLSKKRGPVGELEQCSAGECTSSQSPDTLVLDDGTKYAITDITKPLLDELVSPGELPPYIAEVLLTWQQ
jgi:hypothetical protein